MLWGTPSGPETHCGFEPGTPGSPGPHERADGKTLSSTGDLGMLLGGAYFFFPQVPRLHSFEPYFPSGAFCPLWGTPSRSWTHHGFELGMPGSPEPRAGADGKALSCMGDPVMLLVGTDFFFFCHRCLTSPPSNLTFPSGAFCLLWGTPSRPEMQPGFELGMPESPGHA